MATRTVNVTIQGKTPLIMHRFPLEPIEALEKKPKKEQAEVAAYRDAEGRLYVPGLNIQRSFVSSATYSKGKGRASMQKPVAAGVLVTSEYATLEPQEYVIDARAVVVPATRGRVVRYRPRFDKWQVSFTMEYDDALMTEAQLRRVVDDAGERVGLLDFRPEKKGMFGRFFVTKWEAE
jgi:hypothetical protein